MATCTFFGHKTAPDEVYPTVYREIIALIENSEVDSFYVGNNGNFDRLVRKALAAAKEKFPSITYAVVLAYPPSGTADPDKYDNSIYPEGLELVPQRFAIYHCNLWMLEHSEFVITYVKNSLGGAVQFKNLATRKNKTVIETY